MCVEIIFQYFGTENCETTLKHNKFTNFYGPNETNSEIFHTKLFAIYRIKRFSFIQVLGTFILCQNVKQKNMNEHYNEN